MDRRYAVSIGIKKAGPLRELPGAVNGAIEFYDWARGKGYVSFLITDEKEPVTLLALRSIISDIVTKDLPERLLLYFAGHGVQQMIYTPVWLLSGWKEDEREAVNVHLTMFMANRSGISRVGIFADACRNVIGEAAILSPQSIFPRQEQTRNPLMFRTQCDRFFSSRFDEISQEVNAVGTTAAYGVFTHCLMDALKGKKIAAIELNPIPGVTKAVTSEKLADFLHEAVPRESGKTEGAEVQIPDVESLWRRPDMIYNSGPFVEEPNIVFFKGLNITLGPVLAATALAAAAAPGPERLEGQMGSFFEKYLGKAQAGSLSI
jgi:Caspase domain